MAKYKKFFLAGDMKNFTAIRDKIIDSVDTNYRIISADTAFAASSKNPIDKRLDFCSYFLALIKTLDEKGETFEAIRKICLEIVTEYVKPKNKAQKFLKRLFPKLTNTWFGQMLIKSFHKRVSI